MILHLLVTAALAAEPAIDPQAVTYTNLPEDSGIYTPWAEVPTSREIDPFVAEAVEAFRRQLATWPPAQAKDPTLVVESCLALAALLDAARHPAEFDAPALLLAHLQAHVPREVLIQALARAALRPELLTLLTEDATFQCRYTELQDLRDRMAIYARKMLGRVLGRLPVR